ncbi:MAG TPA: NADAR family protein, partial [Anaerovoracaceae bacterium]|nr:NADAR family protein [Anaerovoracaceae bacterium]
MSAHLSLMTRIDSFTGPYFFLSNFYMTPIVYEGLEYPSSEHVYQAAKTTIPFIRQVMAGISTPGVAKAYGRSFRLRDDWENIKIPI